MLFYFISTVADTLSTVAHHTTIDTIYVSSNESAVIKLIPIIIATLALIATYFSIKISRDAVKISKDALDISNQSLEATIKHNKYSLRPILTYTDNLLNENIHYN